MRGPIQLALCFATGAALGAMIGAALLASPPAPAPHSNAKAPTDTTPPAPFPTPEITEAPGATPGAHSDLARDPEPDAAPDLDARIALLREEIARFRAPDPDDILALALPPQRDTTIARLLDGDVVLARRLEEAALAATNRDDRALFLDPLLRATHDPRWLAELLAAADLPERPRLALAAPKPRGADKYYWNLLADAVSDGALPLTQDVRLIEFMADRGDDAEFGLLFALGWTRRTYGPEVFSSPDRYDSLLGQLRASAADDDPYHPALAVAALLPLSEGAFVATLATQLADPDLDPERRAALDNERLLIYLDENDRKITQMNEFLQRLAGSGQSDIERRLTELRDSLVRDNDTRLTIDGLPEGADAADWQRWIDANRDIVDEWFPREEMELSSRTRSNLR